ncbi:DUF3104 domain-containing protein [Prochlorococcus marinus]|uniref:DUF3104 domain-containing protein n=1 Tax=Prochlorococcus marinus TaxID=1219 RepID=UPI0022B3120A|nr:DUF3104 domain-containing protein [Prochlorococcus marinus]
MNTSRCAVIGVTFLSVRSGDFVAISSSDQAPSNWWVGKVLSRVGNSIDANVNTLFQVIDIDTGVVKIINADFVMGIIQSGYLANKLDKY